MLLTRNGSRTLTVMIQESGLDSGSVPEKLHSNLMRSIGNAEEVMMTARHARNARANPEATST